MDGLAPPLVLLQKVRQGLLSGVSLRVVLSRTIPSLEGACYSKIKRWWLSLEEAVPLPRGHWQGESIHRQALAALLEEGLQGASIMGALDELESEIKRAMEDEVERFVATLPLSSLLPLVFFIFPALLMVLFGPLILQFWEVLK